MAAFSDYVAQNLLNTLFRGVAFPAAPSNVYIALFTASPTDAGLTTNELTNGTAPGYARLAVSTSGSFSAPTPSGGIISTSNNNALEYAQASGNWAGPITHAAVFDASTGGNMLFFGALPTPRTIATGDVLRYAAHALVFSLT